MAINAIILHSIEDAKHCIQDKLFKNNLLFSTHPGVDVYLKEKYNLDCHCLNSFLTKEEMIECKKTASDIVDNLLTSLDSNISPYINKRTGLNMKYFIPLYSLQAKYDLISYVSFCQSISKILSVYKFKKISFYYFKFDYFFDTSTDIDYFIKHFKDDRYNTQIIRSPSNNNYYDFNINRFFNLFKVFKMSIWKYAKNALDAVKTNMMNNKPGKRKNILLYKPLYQLYFLEKELNGHNIFFIDDNDKHNRSASDGIKKLRYEIALLLTNYDFIGKQKDKYAEFIFKNIVDDFLKHIDRYLKCVFKYRQIHKSNPISLGIWGLPPNHGLKALIAEYFKSQKVKIIGSQHGASYGDFYEPWQFDSDFNRCDYFISYGFTNDDLNRIYPNKEIKTKIMPLGMIKQEAKTYTQKKVDVLFPLAQVTSMFNAGVVGMCDRTAQRQVCLLEYLDSLKGYNICVKLLPNSTHENNAILSLLSRLNNLEVVNDISLIEYLQNNHPRSVVIEYPSTPLYEVLSLDTEIFLMDHLMFPFEARALEELKKRVHYSENTEEIISKIDLFIRGRLGKKRDNSFCNHYVHENNSKENILELIGSLVNQN